jgi:Histidine kinase-, DNA gyrase B-, and HSP90-like ATPase
MREERAAMTMLSLSRRLGITPRPDRDEYDPAAAGWLDSGRPEDHHEGAVPRAFVPQQWAGTSAVRDRERANYAADDRAAGDRSATARGPHPLGFAEPGAAPPWAPEPPFAAEPSETQPIDRLTASAPPDSAWPEICDQLGARLLVLAEQVRTSLNALEVGEDDPDRLKRLYQVDHAVTRMRLTSRQLRTLAGRNEERRAGFTTSLVDVIRMASSAIEWYHQVSIGPVTDLAVLGYAADDIAMLMSALLDNATRYSPGMVTVSCHLLEEGGVMFRIEDTGLGIARDQIPRLNAAFAGAVPDVNESTARHTGFPVVHRIARKHSIGVRFASRRRPGTGTLAMVTVPPQLLCAITAQDTPHRTAAAEPSAPRPAATAVPDLPRRERADLMETASVETASALAASPEATSAQAPPTQAPPIQAPPIQARPIQAPPAQAASPAAALPEAASPAAAPLEAASPVAALPEAASPAAAPLEAASPVAALPEAASPEVVPSAVMATEVVATEAVPPEAVSTEPDQDQEARPSELPRREPPSARSDEPRPAEAVAPSQQQQQQQPQPQPQPQQAAARRAFADDLSAFSQGIQDALAARGITGSLVSAMFNGAPIEEGPQS